LIEPALTPEIRAQFLAKVASLPDQPDACWLWTGQVNQHGYGKFYVRGLFPVTRTSLTAIRIAYYLANGVMEDDKFVCHTCDTPTCCNPRHLWLGTHKQNLRDMWAKGRGPVQIGRTREAA